MESVGWREWVSLPDLEIPWIKAKIDTGARSSSIHADDIEFFTQDGIERVRFTISPWQNSDRDTSRVEADLLDHRSVKSSSGESEQRATIRTTLALLDSEMPVELTLTSRDQMGFRMLVGREALRTRFVVDAGRSYRGKRPAKDVRQRNRENDEDE